MSKTFNVGDHVRWNSEAGEVSGVIKKSTRKIPNTKGTCAGAVRKSRNMKSKAIKLIILRCIKAPR